MRKTISLAIVIIGFLFISARLTQCESLVDIGNLSYSVGIVVDYSVPITALLLDNDTVVSGSGAGIYIGTADESQWRIVIGCRVPAPDWYPDCYRKEKAQSLISPEHLWWLPDSKQIVVYDGHCSLIMTLEGLGTKNVFAEIWRDTWDANYLHNASLCGKILLGQKWIGDENVILLQRTDDPGVHKKLSYRMPATQMEQSRSIGLGAPSFRPALNPKDSTIWVEVSGSDQIIVLDMKGRLIDSVPIVADDWIPPGKPKSRISSKAVWREWVSRWTPTKTLQYAEPCYLFLQYRTGWQKFASDSIPLHSTLVWKSDRKPIKLEIDHKWQLAGVQPDGRVIFGEYDVSGDSVNISLHVTRIEP